MDITSTVVSSRERALTFGDYNTYQTQLANRIHNCRKKLHVATRHRGKFNPKTSRISAEQVAEDVTYVRLQLLTAERAFAHAMGMKQQSARTESKAITGRTRSHIASRLDKAAKHAEVLSSVLQEDASGASSVDRLEARAYAAMLRASAFFEKQNWQPSLANYAAAWAIYSALSSSSSSSSSSSRTDALRGLVVETIEPPLRYAAYQLKMPRSKPIPIIVREALTTAASAKFVTGSDTEGLVSQINDIDRRVLQPDESSAAEGAGVVASTRTLTWRSREVRIEDASIASAWASLDLAKDRLAATLAANLHTTSPRDKAAAYDEVLEVSQDAVDTTKAAIDDLRGEGLPQSDPAVQVLYIARTAANYEMISYRIGRNRVLTGDHDGATLQQAADGTAHAKSRQRTKKAKTAAAAAPRPEAPGRFIARLKEKIVLYDGTLQSLETVKELPGVAGDEDLSEQLDATVKYFVALKSLAIARSYSVAGQAANALALVKHGYDQCTAAAPGLAKIPADSGDDDDKSSSSSPLLTIRVSGADGKFLLDLLQTELQRYRALVDIEKLQAKTATPAQKSGSAVAATAPLSQTLGAYPRSGAVDLDNIVAYPPKLEGVPVKPLFLDIAWNYIEYPSKSGAARTAAGAAAPSKGAAAAAGGKAAPEQPQKRGWFGFGR